MLVEVNFTLTGPQEELDRFAALFAPYGGDFTFQALVPIPADAPKPLTEEWTVKNWGCYGDADDSALECGPGSIEVWFNTEWSSPKLVLKAIAEQFPKLALSGTARCEEGEFNEFFDGAEGFFSHNVEEVDESFDEEEDEASELAEL